jgi:hypothetical protein
MDFTATSYTRKQWPIVTVSSWKSEDQRFMSNLCTNIFPVHRCAENSAKNSGPYGRNFLLHLWNKSVTSSWVAKLMSWLVIVYWEYSDTIGEKIILLS